LVGEAVLLGDRRNFVSALMVPNFAALDQRLRELKAAPGPREELVRRPDVVAEYQKVVDRVNLQLGQFERIKKFVLLPAEFTLARGELTPTMKVRRQVVEELWAKEIEGMYGDK
ncbi:MAG: long-chain fatty acid--CoA ligase, partial [Acidobacteria bacterium]|nr:long-chain fatty acid--CoA ligase [Acidobacteriota bacterium]